MFFMLFDKLSEAGGEATSVSFLGVDAEIFGLFHGLILPYKARFEHWALCQFFRCHIAEAKFGKLITYSL